MYEAFDAGAWSADLNHGLWGVDQYLDFRDDRCHERPALRLSSGPGAEHQLGHVPQAAFQVRRHGMKR